MVFSKLFNELLRQSKFLPPDTTILAEPRSGLSLLLSSCPTHSDCLLPASTGAFRGSIGAEPPSSAAGKLVPLTVITFTASLLFKVMIAFPGKYKTLKVKKKKLNLNSAVSSLVYFTFLLTKVVANTCIQFHKIIT